MFGARCSTELTNDITHVVAAKVCFFVSTCSSVAHSFPIPLCD